MKKIIALLLVLVMTMALFAGCTDNGSTNGTTDPNPTEGTQATEGSTVDELNNARAYLKNMYKDSNGTQTKRDYTVVSVVSIGSNTYNIDWTIETVSGDASCVTVTNDGTTATIQILNSEPAEEVQYNLVGTITNGTDTVTVSFSHYIEAAKATGVVFDKAPAAGTAYKLALEQNSVGSTLYFTGNMAGYYMESTENPFEAADVYLEEVDGGLRLYFLDAEGVQTYIDLVLREGYTDKANISLTTEPTAVYTWDSERGTLVAQLGAESFYIGTYSTYTTFSVSNFSYISDASVIGDSQFPAGLATVNITPTKVTAPVAGTAYKYVVEQVNADATLYFTGEMSGYYMASTENPGAAVDVYLEEVDGGLQLYFLQGESKVYIDLVLREGFTDKANIVLTDAPSAVYTWDSERGALVAQLGEESFYIGTYSTYTTFSVSNFSYISDVSVIGDSQFPAGFCTVEGFMGVNLPAAEDGEPVEDNTDDNKEDTSATEPDSSTNSGETVTAPATDVAYYLYVNHETVEKTLYFVGTTANKDYYMSTSTSIGDAVEVYLEAVDGGYLLYFYVHSVKTYLDIFQNGSYINARITAEPTAVYTWNSEFNTLVATLEDGTTTAYIGAYGTYETLSASSTSYLGNDGSFCCGLVAAN